MPSEPASALKAFAGEEPLRMIESTRLKWYDLASAGLLCPGICRKMPQTI